MDITAGSLSLTNGGQLLAGVDEKTNTLPLTDAQQQELDRRLERYQQEPTSGSTWGEVKQRLGLLVLNRECSQ
ncbi:hypothetical protein F7734_00325 [Scytonema sp. UIC 10036]|uniref:addiction module protein n=1 Tax=Scytonema sp. UIC 10036 TaxID=2304196 RepID=UPI00137D74F8|nr:hypothetical protein [Scytonema sp. UIC 10036]